MRRLSFYATIFAFLLIWSIPAHADIIDDSTAGVTTYWGGRVRNAGPNSYGDIISGPLHEFAVNQMEVVSNANEMTVRITGPYFYNYLHNIGLARDYAPGDLYINGDGWIVSGTGHYSTDTFTNTEGWDYVVTNGSIYALNFATINKTSAPLNYVWREEQAWKDGYGLRLGDATVELEDYAMTFTFNTSNLNFGEEIGFHWTMKCGNDIVEGKVPNPVPEPASILLLACGLVGIGAKMSLKRIVSRSK